MGTFFLFSFIFTLLFPTILGHDFDAIGMKVKDIIPICEEEWEGINVIRVLFLCSILHERMMKEQFEIFSLYPFMEPNEIAFEMASEDH